jgi:hypothetical protein
VPRRDMAALQRAATTRDHALLGFPLPHLVSVLFLPLPLALSRAGASIGRIEPPIHAKRPSIEPVWRHHNQARIAAASLLPSTTQPVPVPVP